MNLLFSINDRFTKPFLTTLYSIYVNTPQTDFDIYILQKEALKDNDLIHQYCQSLNMTYHPVIVGENIFEEAPASDRWPESIYYRLLAHNFLPETLDKILYLDADILCINNLSSLYMQDIEDYLYAASSHTRLEFTDTINRLRLGNHELASYYNSGVLLMNLDLIRQEVRSEAIFQFIQDNHNYLLLPDQDILNALYGDKVFPLADEIYNFDSRLPILYELLSQNEYNLDWVVNNTVILHFCGKDKPWQEGRSTKFSFLYKHYQSLSTRLFQSL